MQDGRRRHEIARARAHDPLTEEFGPTRDCHKFYESAQQFLQQRAVVFASRLSKHLAKFLRHQLAAHGVACFIPVTAALILTEPVQENFVLLGVSL